MKNTLIALAASAVALGSVNAQTASFTVDSAFSVGDTSVQWSVLGTDGVSSGTLTATTNISGGFQQASDGSNDIATVLTFERPGNISYSYSGAAIDASSIQGIINSLAGNINNSAFTSGTVESNPGSFVNSSTGATLTSGTNLSGVEITDLDNSGSLIIGSDFGFSVDYTGVSDTDSNLVITSTSFNLSDASSIPEPSSTLLLGLSALGLIARRKR